MEVLFDGKFLKEFSDLPVEIQIKARLVIEIFKSNPSDVRLHRHKLVGALSGCWAISVNYRIRIIFVLVENGDIIFRRIGDHSLYDTFRP